MSSARKRRRDGVTIDPAKLAQLIDDRALSQKKLSARSGIPDRTLRYYLDGERRPRPANFRRLYIALGCGPEDLIPGKVKRMGVIDKNAYRKEQSARSLLSPEEALSTLEHLARAAGWSGVLADTAGECFQVLRSVIEG